MNSPSKASSIKTLKHTPVPLQPVKGNVCTVAHVGCGHLWLFEKERNAHAVFYIYIYVYIFVFIILADVCSTPRCCDVTQSAGKWMDGWESRRKRIPGHDWCKCSASFCRKHSNRQTRERTGVDGMRVVRWWRVLCFSLRAHTHMLTSLRGVWYEARVLVACSVFLSACAHTHAQFSRAGTIASARPQRTLPQSKASSSLVFLESSTASWWTLRTFPAILYQKCQSTVVAMRMIRRWRRTYSTYNDPHTPSWSAYCVQGSRGH